MKKILLLIFSLLIGGIAPAQNLQDVVYLKDGGVVRGTLIEQVPDVKIHTADGSIWVFESDKVDHIAQEPYQGKNNPQAPDLVPSYAGGRPAVSRRSAEYQPLGRGMRMMLGTVYQQKLDHYSCSAMDVDLSIGWQFAPSIFVGFGMADQIYLDYWFYGYYSYQPEPVAQVPFFLDFRYDLKPAKFSPFADVRFGYSFTSDEYVNYSGMYLNPSIGVRYNRLSFSIGLEAVKLEDPMMVVTYNNSYNMNETEVLWQGAFQFRIAYEWGGRR